ncbi:YqcC family protein [Motiliproteus sp. MSK22-1]|uniref:YqcC family protein n=1 Tax=Motiliproteus sp. MSK22-1 TaxID=1897630 RepID=UPI000976EAD9|nr:YqcC family protein [Motiliproteus sp. MSK22-1]OMH33947.1 hypothetical protein BGP75_13345 [Motiliproteus sp. MSK22-1]
MADRHDRLRLQLTEIEQALRLLDLWSESKPDQRELASTQPFCIDTLSLDQWLQWILIPRMKELLDTGLPLPGNCNIHAIAEESFKDLRQDCSHLLVLLKQFDETLMLPH